MKFSLEAITRNNVRELKAYSSARDEFQDLETNNLFFDANENPFENGLNRYPDPHQCKLKEVYAKRKNLAVEQILFGNGSDEILDLLFRAFCQPREDAVLTMPPTYGMYTVLAHLNEIAIQEVSLTKDFSINTNAVLEGIQENTKLLFVCSPNNPSGNVLAEESITTLLNNFNGLVVIDEAYIDFSGSNSWVSQLDQYPNLVVTQTFSKAWGKAGIRLGACFASKEIIAILKRIKPPYNVNALTQNAALRALEENKLEHQLEVLQKEKERLSDALNKINIVKRVYPSDANFLLVQVDDAVQRYKELIQGGIVVRNRHGQMHCDQCLRITVGTAKQNNQLIKIIKEIS
ncbi:MAG: histidinol-phosphate transaminase [Flavobacteriaceae bacterium]|nr:histidinol-phosphate transaminase [Flavobacteriaceae bacterium]